MFKKWMVVTLALCVLLAAMPAAQAAMRLDLNKYAVVRFEKNQAIYTGPGTDYLRANSGKALLGARGECRMYGAVGSWLLVGYQLSNGDYRIGYVPKSAAYTISRDADIGTLQFDMTVRTIVSDCSLTDDPVLYGTSLGWLMEGTHVTLLEDMYDWAYVETTIKGQLTRGFVRSENIGYEAAVSSDAAMYPSYAFGNLSGYVLPRFKTAKLGGCFAIFTGPGEDYYRAQNIAYVGRTTQCRVYGREGEWALVAYQTSSGAYRFGYVPASVIPARLQITDITVAAKYCHTKGKTALSEDPINRGSTLTQLSANTEMVFISYLDSSREWALVELTFSPVGYVRGYVRSSMLVFD